MFLGNTRVWVCCATLLLTGVLQKNIHKSYQHTTSKSYHTVRNFESFNDDLWSTCVLPCSWHKSPALKWRFFYCTSPANQRHSVYGSKLVLATAKGETMSVGFGNYIIRPRDSSCRNLSWSRWGGGGILVSLQECRKILKDANNLQRKRTFRHRLILLCVLLSRMEKIINMEASMKSPASWVSTVFLVLPDLHKSL